MNPIEIKFKALTSQIGRHTIQILKKNELGNLRPHGSGVLLQIRGMYFIITASHVSNDYSCESPLYIQKNDNSYQLIQGDLHETDLDVEDNLDLAIFKLNERTVDLLPSHLDFLEIDFVAKDAIDIPGTPYLISGFPVESTEVNEREILGKGQIYHVTSSNDKPKKYYKIDDKTNYVIDYKGKGMKMFSNEKRKLPEPYGISGGGLWRYWINKTLYSTIYEYNLAGIMVEFKKGKYMVMIGVRIDFVIDKIRDEYG